MTSKFQKIVVINTDFTMVALKDGATGTTGGTGGTTDEDDEARGGGFEVDGFAGFAGLATFTFLAGDGSSRTSSKKDDYCFNIQPARR